MYISNEIHNVSIQWTEICRHEYERISRPKWKIDFYYKCGARMEYEDISDDMIQCLILGAFNSNKEIETNLGKLEIEQNVINLPIENWRELQSYIIPN